MKTVLQSVLLIASIPLIALAIEPSNPSGFCDRFIGEKDVQTCKERTEKDDVDWYAGTVCNLQKEDTSFWKCWDSIKGKSFNPQALEKCGEDKDLSDDERLSCVQSAHKARTPASSGLQDLFQQFKFKGRN